MSIDLKIPIDPKEEYEPLYVKRSRYKFLWGGRGRGGSHEATLYANYRLTSPSYCRCAFVRKVFKDVKKSIWQDFKDRNDETGTAGSFKLNDQDCSGYNAITGNSVTSFGVKAEKGRTAKLKSLAGYNLIVIEEFDELTEEEFDTIDDSLRTIKGEPEIVCIFNPPGKLHWIWKRFFNLMDSEVEGYWRAEPKAGEDMVSIFSTYRDNYKNLARTTVAKWLKYKDSKPWYYYTMIEGLISEGQRGRVYKGWRPITDEDFQDIEAKSVFVLDFGWSESPMALVELKLVKNKVYVREHIYEPMTLKDLAIKMKKLGITMSNVVVADSEDPVSINQLRRGWKASELSENETKKFPQGLSGFNIVGAIKGPGSINMGISMVQEREVYVTEDSLNIWEEYKNYRWALDVNKNPTNEPEDEYDHCMDGIRYGITGKGRVYA